MPPEHCILGGLGWDEPLPVGCGGRGVPPHPRDPNTTHTTVHPLHMPNPDSGTTPHPLHPPLLDSQTRQLANTLTAPVPTLVGSSPQPAPTSYTKWGRVHSPSPWEGAVPRALGPEGSGDEHLDSSPGPESKQARVGGGAAGLGSIFGEGQTPTIFSLSGEYKLLGLGLPPPQQGHILPWGGVLPHCHPTQARRCHTLVHLLSGQGWGPSCLHGELAVAQSAKERPGDPRTSRPVGVRPRPGPCAVA